MSRSSDKYAVKGGSMRILSPDPTTRSRAIKSFGPLYDTTNIQYLFQLVQLHQQLPTCSFLQGAPCSS